MDDEIELLTTAEAAEILRVSATQLERWRWERKGPRFGRCGRQVVYERKDLREWLDERFAEWDNWQAS